MVNQILEMSTRANKAGRVAIKIGLHKIHDVATETNMNGLHWKSEYVKQALDTIPMSPICASFTDEDKEIPLDHGLTGIEFNDKGLKEPVFENSETVGSFESASIETVNINGEDVTMLVGNGYLYNQRYPKFVKWVRKNRSIGKVDTSIEIMGLEQNDNKIIYEEDNPTQSFRTPMEYSYSGCAILSVQPADDNAIVLEVAQNKHEKKEDENMEFTIEDIKNAVSDVMSANVTTQEQHETEISELNTQIEQKDATIAEKENEINSLNEQLTEANEKIASYAEMENELNELKKEKAINELNNVLADYSEEEQKYAESEINAYKESPLEGDLNVITSKICVGIVAAQKDEQRIAEQNNKDNNEIIDIFSEVSSVEENDGEDEDVNIF